MSHIVPIQRKHIGERDPFWKQFIISERLLFFFSCDRRAQGWKHSVTLCCQKKENHHRSHFTAKLSPSQTTLCKAGHFPQTGCDHFPNWNKLGLLIIVTQDKMSAWHDVLIFHLRNGGFHEQTQTLHSPLPLPVSALPWVDFSGVDLTDTQKVEGPETGEDSCPLLSFYRSSCGNENGVGGEGRLHTPRKCGLCRHI